ncbi:MAG: hypothetical protein Q9219_002849 [cf. Caloplaca sp. 3 TL-2023]
MPTYRSLQLNGWKRKPEELKKIDRWLYGHPEHKFFDSPYQFYPHWKFLLNFGNGELCNCALCTGKSNHKSRRSSTKSVAALEPQTRKAQALLPLRNGPVDEEGTPDVYCALFTLLKHEGGLKRKIEERQSLDWRAEKPLVDTFAGEIPNQPSFLPREGEIVLYLRPLPSPLELRQDRQSHHFKIYNPTAGSYVEEYPQWLAGIVTQVPTSPPTVSSLSIPPPSTASLNSSGYRISPLPSPNSSNKLLSKQQTYTSLHLIRPFCLHPHILAGIPPSDQHESISNSLTASATVSLIDRHSFSGDWPHAHIHSRGIFIGTEAYWIGDVVVLLGETPSSEPSTEILHISDIVTTFHALRPVLPSDRIGANHDIENTITGNDCDRISISLHGPVYTCDPSRTKNPQTPIPFHRYHYPPSMQNHGQNWYYLDQPGETWAAPFSRVLSRLYEPEALAAWLPHPPPPPPPPPSLPSTSLLDLGRQGILHARTFAAETDERILAAAGGRGKRWFWAEYRAEGLDLGEVAGVEVGRYDGEREVGVWRGVLRVLDGVGGGMEVGGRSSGGGSGSSVEEEEEEEEEQEVKRKRARIGY